MSRQLRGLNALCIVTAVDTHTHRKVGTQSFRSKGLHWPTTAGLPARNDQSELIRKTAAWFQCILLWQSVPSEASRGITREIRRFREERLVQFNFTLIYSVSELRLVARSRSNLLKGLRKCCS